MRSLTSVLCTLCCLFLINLQANGQVVLAQESFEAVGGDFGFTANFGGACNDFWDRVTSDPSCFGSSLDGSADGNAWVAGEDIDAALGANVFGTVTLNAVNVTGQSSLDIQVAASTSNSQGSRWEFTDNIYFEYNMDNSGWVIAGLFKGDGQFGGFLREDTDLNPGTNGPYGFTVANAGFQDYTFSIPVTGNSVQVRVRADIDGGTEEIGIDNIRVRGIMSSNVAPVLANIEGGTIMYSEGDPATQITNTITVSDSDDTDLESATVQILTNFDGSEDVLAFTPTGGITGTFNNVTGILSLSGTSSLANYQTVLRSVTYENTDANDADPATRTIRFSVNDGLDNSNFQSRDISISTSLNSTPLTVPFCESFETNGEGSRYESNNFVGTCPVIAERGLNTSMGFGCFAENITGPNGTYVFFTESTTNIPGSSNFTLTSQDIDISGLNDMTLEVLLGISRDTEDRWESTDQFRVEYNVDGGAYTIIGLFTGTNPNSILGGPLAQDTDNNPGTLGPFGTTITDIYQNFTFNFNVSGSVMTYRIVVLSTGTEELAFDNICLTGTAGQVGPTLANIEGSTISYTEGDPATQITNTITITDPDDTNMESATVNICSGFVNGEDVLAFTSFGGISGTYTAATGILALSGSASIADYESTLRSVTYQNTDISNPENVTREICFVVNDGDVNSNQQSRMIDIIDLLNAPACLPVMESFETDGEGTRYNSTTFDDSGSPLFNCDFFIRTNSQPSCHADAISNVDGNFYWAGEDVTGGSNGSGPAFVELAPLIATGYTSLQVQVLLGLSNNSGGFRIESDDAIFIQSNLDNAGWVNIGAFYGDGDLIVGGDMRQDADLNGVADPAGTILTSTLQDFTFSIPGTGDNLRVRVVIDQSGGSEETIFDNIRVNGTLSGGTATVTCPSDPSTINGCSASDVTSASSLAFSTTSVTISEADFTGEGGTISPMGSTNSITYIDVASGSNPITVTRTFTISSGCNSSEDCVQTFTIQDSTDPTVSCPSDITVGNDPGQCGAAVSFTPSANDNCPVRALCLEYSGLPRLICK